MAEEVVVEGASLEEARSRAAAALGCSVEELKVEVLSEGKGGLWSRARVRIRARRAEEGQLDGRVWIEEGTVAVADPEPGGRPAVLGAGPHVRLWINEVPVGEPRPVTSLDQVRVEAEVVEGEVSVDVEVAPDGMSCVLRVRRKPREVYAVEDAEPSNRLTIRARVVESTLPPLSVEEVLARLAAAKVVYGVDREAVQQAVERGDGEPVVVARGTPPTPPVDAQIEYLFLARQEEFERQAPGRRRVFAVEPGEVLAVKKPPVAGTPGKDVHGRAVEPPPPRDAPLRAGNGTRLREDGLAVVATTVGRPERRGSLITVVPVYVVEGDADPREGPIKFKGDIVVQGDALDGTVIEAGGNLRVKGLVANATLTAGGSILVEGNVVGSKLKAGGMALVWEKWWSYWQEIDENVRDFLLALEQLREQWEKTRPEEERRIANGALIKVLLDTRYRQLPQQLEKARAATEELFEATGLEAEHPFREALGYLCHYLAEQGHMALASARELAERFELARQEAQALQQSALEAGKNANITAFYVQNSVLETTGQVVVNGKGCYNCSVYAGNGVVIGGVPGAFRGGQIISKGHVRVQQLGSPAEVRTFVQVPKHFTIRAVEAFPGVLLKAGSRVEKITAHMAVNLLGE
ncbi:MAG: FapA family protein [Clostridia bacterium]|jgi:uncharacterized protein (DUF342 family)|nr:FapA family protein [Clostridia bacterium]MDH7572604.1 FapA family protein [Clostridia bacterium]